MTQTDNVSGGIATLAADATTEFDSSAPWKVNGVALPVNTVVNGGQNVDHYFPEEVLQRAAELLEGIQIVKNFHDIDGQASADQVIGKITSAAYQKGVGLVFEGEVSDKDIAEKVSHGYLDVSPTVARSLGEFDDSMGAQRVNQITGFRDLAVVANGQPGAKIEIGGNSAVTALGMDALSRGFEFDVLESDFKTVAGVRFRGTKDGKLDESEIPTDDFESHYLYPGENKSESSYPVVDGDGYLRKGNVDSAWQLGARGDISDEEHDSKLMDLANEFDSPPEWAQDSMETTGAESPADADTVDTQSDDGTDDVMSPSSAANSTTMSENELSETEKAVLAAADGVENATDVLNAYTAAEQPEIVEQDVLSEKDEQIAELTSVFRDVLAQKKDLSEEIVADLSVDALTSEFRNEEGEIMTETLSQVPETGDVKDRPDEEPEETDTLSADDKEEIKSLLKRADLLKSRTPDHADTLRSEAAALAGVDDADEIEVDAL